MITMNVKTVREALRGFGKLNPGARKNPALHTVRFTPEEEGVVKLAATDLDHQLVHKCGGTADGNEDFLIPVEKLRGCVKNQKAGTRLHFHAEDGDRHLIRIDDGTVVSEVGCGVQPVGDYPDFGSAGKRLTEIPASGVRAIREATGSASTDPTRLVLNSVLLEPGGVVATNGRVLYRSNSLNLDIGESIAIPNHRVIGLLDPESPAVLYGPEKKGDRAYRLVQDGWEWDFRSVDGTYPDYTQVLPRDEEERVRIELSDGDAELLERVNRLPFVGKKDAFAGLRRRGNELRLMAGRGEDRQVCQLNPSSIKGGGDTHVFFNYTFLMEGLRNGMRNLSLKDELAPVTMRGDGKTQLFMPLRGNQTEEDWKLTRAHARAQTPASEAAETHEAGGNGRSPETESAAGSDAPKAGAESPAPVDTRREQEDGIAELIREATQVRDSLKDTVGGLNRLIKTARRAGRRHSDLEREHAALKKSVRSLQKIEV